jgi:long-chain acyl-CoA synthetase
MPIAPDVRTVVDLFETAVAGQPDKAMLRSKVAGIWHPTTGAQWRSMSAGWARGLLALGLQPGDRVGIISATRREWVIADMAILLAGGVTVPVYHSAVADETQYILQNSGARFVFVEDPAQLDKVIQARETLPDLQKVVCFQDIAQLDRPDAQGRTTLRRSDVMPTADDFSLTLAQLSDLGRDVDESRLTERRQGLSPDQPCTIVYTSGTTGRPKGVVLSHAAFVFEVDAATRALDVNADDAVMLFLPLAHIFAKIIYFVCVQLHTEMIFPQSIATLMADMAESKPTVLPSVPRIFEKAHAKILAGVNDAGPVKRRLFEAALATGREVSRLQQKGRAPTGLLAIRHAVAHKLVFAKIHALFGGRMRAFISGGAPLSRELAEFFHACGLLILEGYGLTENCAAATINRPERFKFGTVGQAIEGVEIRIATDGEILIRGPNLLTEYWKNPEATAEALQDGWFHTGDIGELDDEGFLRITDRKKDIIVTAGGKNVAPQNIENHLKNSAFLSQAMVYGDRRKFLSALLTLDEEAMRHWAEEHHIAFGSFAELSQNAEVFKFVQALVDEKNRTLASYETIKKFAILERDLTIEDGDLTPSLKLRRKEVTRKHQGLLDSFYSEHY